MQVPKVGVPDVRLIALATQGDALCASYCGSSHGVQGKGSGRDYISASPMISIVVVSSSDRIWVLFR